MTKQNQPDYILFLLVSSLITVSVLFSYSLSVYTVVYHEYNQFHFFIRQAAVGIFSIILMWILAHCDPNKIVGILSMSMFIIFFVVMAIMPFLPGFLVTESGGANRWIRLPGFSLSPIEFFKVGFIYFLAWSFHRRVMDKPKKMKLGEEFLLLLPYFATFLLVVFLVAFLQKDLGQVVLLGVVLMLLLVFANRSYKLFLSLGLAAVGTLVLLIIIAPHRIKRIYSWWAMNQERILAILPDSASTYLKIKELPEPYQVGHSLNAINNGGIFGRGLGEGNLKMGFLSEVHTDFVLAGITEEIGFIGITLITFILFCVIWRILKVSRRVDNPIYHLFTLGIALMIIIAFLINSYGITGIIPIKGIAVPFLSYGGSAMLASSISIGLVLSISREVRK